jgi:hypothetical protein
MNMYFENVELRLKPEMALKVNWAKCGDVLSVVWCSKNAIAVANMSDFFEWDKDGNFVFNSNEHRKKHQPTKPKVFTFSKAQQLFDFVIMEGGIKQFRLPKVLREPEEVLGEYKLKKWAMKRDKALKNLGMLAKPDAIEQYLLNNGFGSLVETRLEQLREENPAMKISSGTSLLRYINQYISLGCSKNALLPLGLLNTGNNYKHNDDNSVIKRGMGGADSRNTKSLHTGVRPLDKRIIKRIVTRFGINYRSGALQYNDMYYEYCIDVTKHQGISLPEPDESGKRDLSKYLPSLMSYGQFRYHYLNSTSIIERLYRRYGVIKTKRDFIDKQGVATDGVLGANHTVEIDSTELSVHVRDPRVKDKLKSAGRLHLCIAICVKTRYILGYSLSFSKPKWENVAECLYNMLEDKKSYCKAYGISLRDYEWVCKHGVLVVRIDNGKEFPEEQMDDQLRHSSGFFRVEIVPKARGDLKSIVERFNGTIESKVTKLRGGIEKSRDKTEQDASQQALLTIDAVHRKIIREICHHNNYALYGRLLDRDMAENGVGITPNAMWTFSIKHQMGGGRPIAQKQLPSYRYSLLPKCQVTVREDGIHYGGLIFQSPSAKENDWYLEAKFSPKDIEKRMAYTPSLCDVLFYEGDDGKVHTFELSEKCEQYRNLSWLEVSARHEVLKDEEYDARNQREANNVANRIADKMDLSNAENEVKGIPKNDQTSYQIGTNDRRRTNAAEQSKTRAENTHKELRQDDVTQTKTQKPTISTTTNLEEETL